MKPARDSLRYRLEVRVLSWLTAWLLRGLAATWRIRVSGEDPLAHPPVIGALWHQGLFIAAGVWKDRGIAVPVSRSRDGDRIDAVLQRLGFAESPRGSTSRGASSLLRSMIRWVRGGGVIGVLPDGPRGPAGEAQPGVIALARATGVPVVPVGLAATPVWQFGSWDRAVLPRPFARVRCRYGTPIHVPKEAKDEALEALRLELETALGQLNEEIRDELAADS